MMDLDIDRDHRRRDRTPRLFPELWSGILLRACWSLAGLARATTINREIRSMCFSTPQSKCDFLLARWRGDVHRALEALIKARNKAYMMPDLIGCLAVLVRLGARYECGRECGGRWRNCLLRRLLQRADAVAAVTACLTDEDLTGAIKFSTFHRGQALRQAVEAGHVTLITVLRPSGMTGRLPGVGWGLVIRRSTDADAARVLAAQLGLSTDGYTVDIKSAIRACLRRGTGYMGLAKELLGERISVAASRQIWADVDMNDTETARVVIGLGVRPASMVIWRYLGTLESLPHRAADDAFLIELLEAGDLQPSSQHQSDATSIRRFLSRPKLMRDLVDSRMLFDNYLDVMIEKVVGRIFWSNYRPEALEVLTNRTFKLVDEIRAAGGAISTDCFLKALWSNVPEAVVSALVDRVPESYRTEELITELICRHYWLAHRPGGFLLCRSFPVSLKALDGAAQAVWMGSGPEDDAKAVRLFRELLDHADESALIAEDKMRDARDTRLITKVLGNRAAFDEAPRIVPMITMLVEAGFAVKVEDVEFARTKRWVQTEALLQARI